MSEMNSSELHKRKLTNYFKVTTTVIPCVLSAGYPVKFLDFYVPDYAVLHIICEYFWKPFCRKC